MQNIVPCDAVKVSSHSGHRIRERLGINKKSVERNAKKAYADGLKHSETTGRLNKYITALYFQNRAANNIRIYHHYTYIFCGEKLVTVMLLPQYLFDSADKQYARKRVSEQIL